MLTVVDAPRCEVCGKVVGLKVSSDFTLRIATFDRNREEFTAVASAKYAGTDDDDPTKTGPYSMHVCSVACGRRICKPNQFIVVIDEGDIVNPIGAYDNTGKQLRKFW